LGGARRTGRGFIAALYRNGFTPAWGGATARIAYNNGATRQWFCGTGAFPWYTPHYGTALDHAMKGTHVQRTETERCQLTRITKRFLFATDTVPHGTLKT